MTGDTSNGQHGAVRTPTESAGTAKGDMGAVDRPKGQMGAAMPEQAATTQPDVLALAAFDDHHPPSRDLIDDCVHCGFCLPACPTYNLWGEEMDSPRGRIYLMKEGLEGEPMTPSMVQHIDQCLGCMACVTVCPSGVQYDKLIEATRQQVERRGSQHRSLADRALREAIFALFPHPERLRLMRGPLALYQRSGLSRVVRRSKVLEKISPSLATMEAIAPPIERQVRIPPFMPAKGPRRMTVGLLLGCVQREFYPGVNAATVRVLNMEGCDVVTPPAQGCCGALSVHAGREEEGLRYARALIDTFTEAGVERIVVNSAGCGSTMKDYAPPARRRPRLRRAGPGLRREGPGHLRGARRARPRGHAAPAAGDRRLPRRLPPRARPGRPVAAAPAAARHPGPDHQGDRRGRPVLRLRRHLQPRRARSGARARRPQGGQRGRHRGRAAGHLQPRVPAADHRRARPAGACTCRRRT